jgi:hypothetical protein
MNEQVVQENSAAWLRDVILGGAPLRSRDASSVLLEQLTSHYDQLGYADQLDFQNAILHTLAAARPSQPDLLYHLLQLVAHTKPVHADVVLRKLITSRELVYSPEAAAAGLESLALATQAEYGVGPWLADFLARRLAERPDPRTAMAALELLAFQNEVAISTAFISLCRMEDAVRYEGEFLRSSFTALRRTGMQRFYEELDEVALADLASDPHLPLSPYLRAIAAAMDRIGVQDRGYVPLRALITALLGEPVAPWLARCEPGVVMDVIDRVNFVRVAAGRAELVVRPSTTPDYVDEFAEYDHLPMVGLKVVEAESVYYVPVVDAKSAQHLLSPRPYSPISNDEANATFGNLSSLLQKIVGKHVH